MRGEHEGEGWGSEGDVQGLEYSKRLLQNLPFLEYPAYPTDMPEALNPARQHLKNGIDIYRYIGIYKAQLIYITYKIKYVSDSSDASYLYEYFEQNNAEISKRG